MFGAYDILNPFPSNRLKGRELFLLIAAATSAKVSLSIKRRLACVVSAPDCRVGGDHRRRSDDSVPCGYLTRWFGSKQATTIAATPHPKSSCQMQHLLGSSGPSFTRTLCDIAHLRREVSNRTAV